ncbi:MAG: phosphate transport system regulatory protein PhoU [Calditrichaeota bacterium]|nr:MAG: phosphate transport system regulatory protein PhoU [Calditrichota bacterium]
MKEKFHLLLENIKKELIYLATEVEHNIRQSMKALQKMDVELAKQVIASDEDIDRLEVKIEDQILTLLALQQPVAIDLRFIVGGLKMNNDLERIGDHSVNIARTVLEMAGKPPLPTYKQLPQMSELACKMLHDAVTSFIHVDPDLARDVCRMDNQVDEFYDKIVKETIALLKKDPDKLDQGFLVARIARSLERVGDLATNIGEDVVFMKEAKIIRHHFAE